MKGNMVQHVTNTSVYPADAATLNELSVDFLVDHVLARRAEPEGSGMEPRILKQALEYITDLPSLKQVLCEDLNGVALLWDEPLRSALKEAISFFPVDAERNIDVAESAVAEWEKRLGKMLKKIIGSGSFDPLRPLEYQISPKANELRAVIAIARQGLKMVRGDDCSIQLPFTPRFREELPEKTGDEPLIIEIGDLQDSVCASAYKEIWTMLGPMAPKCKRRWIHGPTGYNEKSVYAAGLAEAVAEMVPDMFWDIIKRLYHYYTLVEVDVTRDVTRNLSIDPLKIRNRSMETEIRERIKKDYATVVTCAIPPYRPAFVVNRKLFYGKEQFPNLCMEIEHILQNTRVETHQVR